MITISLSSYFSGFQPTTLNVRTLIYKNYIELFHVQTLRISKLFPIEQIYEKHIYSILVQVQHEMYKDWCTLKTKLFPIEKFRKTYMQVYESRATRNVQRLVYKNYQE